MRSPEGVKFTLTSCMAAHVLVKTTIEQKFRYDTSLPFTTTLLGPTLFFSNDTRSKRSVLQKGFFDEPLGEVGMSRVSTMAVAVKALLIGERFAREKNMIGSLHWYAGAEVCKLWSETIGKEVQMAGSDAKGLDDFEAHFAGTVCGTDGSAWGRDLRLMYETFAKVGFGMSEEEQKELDEVLGPGAGGL